jgi:hypothetical protein
MWEAGRRGFGVPGAPCTVRQTHPPFTFHRPVDWAPRDTPTSLKEAPTFGASTPQRQSSFEAARLRASTSLAISSKFASV